MAYLKGAPPAIYLQIRTIPVELDINTVRIVVMTCHFNALFSSAVSRKCTNARVCQLECLVQVCRRNKLAKKYQENR